MAKGKVRWLGHSACEFTTGDGKVVLFDPWTKDDGNPAAALKLEEVEKADLVTLSHDHSDHIASAVAICQKTGALLSGAVHTVARLIKEGFPAKQVVNFGKGYQPGGGAHLDWLDIYATPANHASDTSVALGTIVRAPDGTTLYHAGDTGLLSEMELYARLYPMDLAFLPIGGVFTMDANQASFSLSLIKPKLCIPIHYASFPIVAKDAEEFVRLSGQRAPEVKVLPIKPGEVIYLAEHT